MDCTDSVCIFLSIGIAGWLEISERSYWEYYSPIFKCFDSVRYERSRGISSCFLFNKTNLIVGPSFYQKLDLDYSFDWDILLLNFPKSSLLIQFVCLNLLQLVCNVLKSTQNPINYLLCIHYFFPFH